MSGIDPKHEGSEATLSRALRELARSTPHGARPELGIDLARAFRRHHFRRRAVVSCALTAVLLACGAGAWLLTDSLLRSPQKQLKAAKQSLPATPILAPATVPISTEGQQQGHTSRNKTGIHRPPAAVEKIANSELFVALPAFALRTPNETLRVVRVEMPASSLRLLGAQVRGEIVDRRVNADLLVGPDGTPYAVRLVL